MGSGGVAATNRSAHSPLGDGRHRVVSTDGTPSWELTQGLANNHCEQSLGLMLKLLR